MTEKNRNWLPLLAWLGLAALILFQAWAYYFRLDMSLGPRMIAQPWFLQNGLILYEQTADQHMMLLPLLLAPLRLLIPDGLQLAKLVLVTLISVSTLLTFVAGRRTAGWAGGLLAAFFFVAWSPVFGFGKLWHETFLTPIYLLLLLLYNPSAPRRSSGSLLLLGIVGGLALLVKQQGAIVFAAFVLWTAFTTWRAHHSKRDLVREVGLMALGAALPFLAFIVYHYAQAGTLRSFWYWTVVYNLTSDYGTLAARRPEVVEVGFLVVSFLLVPAAVFHLIEQKRQGNMLWLTLGWGLALFVTSTLPAYPRFQLFHFQATLPVLAWLSAVTLIAALRPGKPGRSFAAGIAVALSAVWLIVTVWVYQPVVKAGQPQKVWEYSDLVPLAAEIRQQIGPDGCIYVFPDDEATANLYYLTRCLPNYWTFTYSWFMIDPIKQRVLTSLEDDPPEWVVNFPGRWEIEKYAPEIMGYLEEHYRREAELHWAQGEAWLLKRLP